MTAKSILLGARRGAGLAEEILQAKSPEDAREPAGLALAKSVASGNRNKAGLRRMPVTIPLVSPLVRNSIGRSRRGLIPVAILSAWFALSPARAVSPPPDGGYPNENTAEGDSALLSLTTGEANTAIGFQALVSNTTGGINTATDGQALFGNTTGRGNTANGASALLFNTTGNDNTGIGFGALATSTTGNNNTATGVFALVSNTTGQREVSKPAAQTAVGG
jgi:hypothetical protein